MRKGVVPEDRQVVLNLRLDAGTVAQLQRQGEIYDRTPAWIAARAIEFWLAEGGNVKELSKFLEQKATERESIEDQLEKTKNRSVEDAIRYTESRIKKDLEYTRNKERQWTGMPEDRRREWAKRKLASKRRLLSLRLEWLDLAEQERIRWGSVDDYVKEMARQRPLEDYL